MYYKTVTDMSQAKTETPFAFRLPTELRQSMREAAAKRGVSIAELIRVAIKAEIDRHTTTD